MPARPNPEREQKVRDLHAKGLNDPTIAQRLGMQPSGVAAMRKRLGLARQ